MEGPQDLQCIGKQPVTATANGNVTATAKLGPNGNEARQATCSRRPPAMQTRTAHTRTTFGALG
eukprot:8475552-Prorocentrum_lima.AAC.1